MRYSIGQVEGLHASGLAISCTVTRARGRVMWKSPWPAPLGGLEVVRLGGLDAAEARAAALDVDDQRRADPRPP